MTDFWESAFTEKQLMWGTEPTASAGFASDYFARMGVKDVLIPGIGYGRNARAFLDHGMSVTGIEISGTAIALARSQLGLQIHIYHGSVANMPFDRRQYDGIFCYGLIYLLDARGREKFIRDCYRQLTRGGQMIFTVVSRKAPMYGQGKQLGEDRFERRPGPPIYFYDAKSVKQEFGPYGLIEFSEINEPAGEGVCLPFFNVNRKRDNVVVGTDEAVERLRAGQVEVTVDGALEQTQVETIVEALRTSKTAILRMGGCRITDLGGKAIGDALRINASLKELWLFDNEIGDVGGKALGEALRENTSLATLCLNDNRIGDIGCRSIADALQMSIALAELGLGRNQIGEAGATSMGEALASNRSLIALSLNNNRIGDIGAASIGGALPNHPSLQILRLGYNEIGDVGADALRVGVARNTVLTSVVFGGNPARQPLAS